MHKLLTRFRLVSEPKKPAEQDFRFWPREKWNESHFFARSLTLVPRSLLLNRTETLATEASDEHVVLFSAMIEVMRVVDHFLAFSNEVIFPESRPLISVYSYTRIKKQIPWRYSIVDKVGRENISIAEEILFRGVLRHYVSQNVDAIERSGHTSRCHGSKIFGWRQKNSHCFKLHRSYSISFNLSNVGESFWI